MFVNDDYFTKCWQILYDEVRDISKHIKASNGEKEIFGEGEKLLDNQNLSQILHVSYRTLQRYRNEGALPYLKRGQKIYYKASAVREICK
jgi:hypothetical protein